MICKKYLVYIWYLFNFTTVKKNSWKSLNFLTAGATPWEFSIRLLIVIKIVTKYLNFYWKLLSFLSVCVDKTE